MAFVLSLLHLYIACPHSNSEAYVLICTFGNINQDLTYFIGCIRQLMPLIMELISMTLISRQDM